MKNLKISAALLALAALCPNMASAQGNATFSYADKNSVYAYWGTNKKETYNIAIHLVDPSMANKKIVGLRVPAVNSNDISNISGWLTTELGKDGKEAKADICRAEGHRDGTTYVIDFAEPYTMTANGVYAGYSFTVDNVVAGVTDKPVVGTPGLNNEAMYVLTDRTYMAWKDRSEQSKIVSGIEVLFEGDIDSNALGVIIDESTVILAGESFEMPLTLYNHGTKPISEFEYTAKIKDKSFTGVKKFDEPVKIQYGGKFDCVVPINIPTTPGMVELEFTIDKVNGEENKDVDKSVTKRIGMLSYIPTKRVLMEEYTGTWCGFCTRGFAAMEYLVEKYPDTFIPVSFHGGDDPMVTIGSNNYPSAVSAFPSCYVDREANCDPYYGTLADTSIFGIELDYERHAKEFAPVDVEITAKLDETNSKVIVSTRTHCVREFSGSARLVFYLVGDGLTKPNWIQSNYLSGDNPSKYHIPQMEKFYAGPRYVPGLVFNDVVLMASSSRGELSTLQDLKVNVPCKDQYVFDMNSCSTQKTNSYDPWNPALECRDKDNLKVVVAIVNTMTNKVMNANWAYAQTAGVDSIDVDDELDSSVYYDLNGKVVSNPSAGIFVKVDTFKSGKKQSSKVIFK